MIFTTDGSIGFCPLLPFSTLSRVGRHLSSGREAFSRNSLISHARRAFSRSHTCSAPPTRVSIPNIRSSLEGELDGSSFYLSAA